MLPRSRRISKEIFKETHTKGRTFCGGFINLKCLEMARNSRFAIVVSKKIAKTAISRNKARRRVYSIVKDLIPKFVFKQNVIIILKKSVENKSHDELKKEIEEIFVKCGLLK